MSTPRIAITIGDPNGIGPEVILKALSKLTILRTCRPVVVAPRSVIRFYERKLGLELSVDEASHDDASGGGQLVDLGLAEAFEPRPGQVSAAAGEVAGRALEKAVELAQSKRVDAIVTAPISKLAFNQAGYSHAGHTEFFAAKTNAQVVMILMSGEFRVGLATTHCPLSQVSGLLSRDLLITRLRILAQDLRDRFGVSGPRIAVAALNPHAGEGGMLGSEEQEIIAPALEQVRTLGIEAQGPFPADTLFARIDQDKYDAYLAMYHDQGLIALKMRAFGRGVNYTAGLPMIRTSPDHGAAFDIAGKGVADSGSMEEAIKLAVRLAG